MKGANTGVGGVCGAGAAGWGAAWMQPSVQSRSGQARPQEWAGGHVATATQLGCLLVLLG